MFSLTRTIRHITISNNLFNSSVYNYSSATQLHHSIFIKNGSIQMLQCSNYLLSLYLKDSNNQVYARKLFDEIPQPDVKTWTVLISGLSRNGYHRIALDYFTEMQHKGTVYPNVFTLSSVLKCCVCFDNGLGLGLGKAVHGWTLRNGIDVDIALNNAFLDLYSKHGVFSYVKRLFELMGEKDSTSWNIVMAANLSEGDIEQSLCFFKRLPTKSVASWNTIIDGLLQRGFGEKALELVYEMVGLGVRFNEFTFSISLVLASSLKSLELGRQIHGQVLRTGVNRDTFVSTSLIDMYCKCCQMKNASLIFRELRCCKSFYTDSKAQTVLWSTMIAGYVQNGLLKEALTCFTSMLHEQIKADLFTLTTIVTASADMAFSELGQQIHAYTLKSGQERDSFLCSSMIDMYAKCGMLDNAWSLFKQTRSRSVVLWSVMISSYAKHGLVREAIQLFEQLQSESIRPNEVTFVGLLTACSHGGLIEEGCKYFRMMIEVYGIKPGIEHFACMVDLFGRTGHLEEIKGFVYENGIQHLNEVWKAYLSSCWIHKNVEMTNWVSKKLLELQPSEAGPHLMISNAYSVDGAWENAAKSRSLMQEKEVRKLPGQSWIQF